MLKWEAKALMDMLKTANVEEMYFDIYRHVSVLQMFLSEISQAAQLGNAAEVETLTAEAHGFLPRV